MKRRYVLGGLALLAAVVVAVPVVAQTAEKSAVGKQTKKAIKKEVAKQLANKNGPPGPTGPAGPPGPAGTAIIDPGSITSDELGATTIVSDSVANSTQTKTETVSCPAGTQMVSGGGGIPNPGTDQLIARSTPTANGWSVTGTDQSGGTWTLEAFAVCLL